MPVDSYTQQVLTRVADSGAPPLHEMSPHAARQAAAAGALLAGPGPAVHRALEEHAPAADRSAIPLRILVPTATPAAIFVYLHGGGWVTGGNDESDHLGRQLALATNAIVVLADYRLAPEHRYPQAVEDAWDAVRWAADRAADLAGRPVPLIVGGDSAGGNLAAVVARRARDVGGPAIAAQVLVYPVTDCDLDTASYTDPENQLLLNRESMAWFWDHYLPDAGRRGEPDASPLRAPDLSGLPPAIVATAEYDVLRDEGEAYAARLRAAGVPVAHRRFQGQTHGFFTMVGVLPASGDAREWIAARLPEILRAAGGDA